jgi:3-methyladenine DNA glycosylase AlkD
VEPKSGIRANLAFGVPAATLHLIAKRLDKNSKLAGALWDSGWYDARMFACFVISRDGRAVREMG